MQASWEMWFMKLYELSERSYWMLLSAGLGKDSDILNRSQVVISLSLSLSLLLLFPASYPKLCDFHSMFFFFLMFTCMPSSIKNTIAIFAPSCNTFPMFVKGVHILRTAFTNQASRNKDYRWFNCISADNNYSMDGLIGKRRFLKKIYKFEIAIRTLERLACKHTLKHWSIYCDWIWSQLQLNIWLHHWGCYFWYWDLLLTI